MTAVHFRSNEQAIPEIRALALDGGGAGLVVAAEAVGDVDLAAPGCRASRAARPTATGGRCRAPPPRPTPARNASSPRNRAASFSTSRLCSPSPSNAPTRNSAVAIGVPDLERGVPGGQHREVLVVELVHGLRVVLRQLVLGDVVHPRLDHGRQQRTPRLAADRLGDHADRLRRLHEAKRHRRQDRRRSRRNHGMETRILLGWRPSSGGSGRRWAGSPWQSSPRSRGGARPRRPCAPRPRGGAWSRREPAWPSTRSGEGRWSEPWLPAFVVGVWVCASPWIWGYDDVDGAIAADVVTGAAIAVVSLAGVVFPALWPSTSSRACGS